MQNIKGNMRIFYILVFTLLAGSCSDKLITPEPESILTSKQTYSTANNIKSHLLGVYDNLQGKVQSDYLIMGVPTDNEYVYNPHHVNGIGNIGTLTIPTDNPRLNAFWQRSYNAIYKSNEIVNNIDKPNDYRESQKDQYFGEAKFLRALFYFDLARIFGDVPLVLKKQSIQGAENTARTPKEKVLAQVVKDLKDAISKLPGPSNLEQGRASEAAAVSLLSKVYVHLKKWDKAEKYLEQVINNYNYSLVSNFGDLFSLETENNSEAIFSVPFVAGQDGETLTADYTPHGGLYGIISGAQKPIVRPTLDLRRLYKPGDTRLTVTITEKWLPYNANPEDKKTFLPFVNKYTVKTEQNYSSGLDIPILRLGDIMLLYAEALYKTDQPQEALKQLNRIRERAFHDSEHNYQISDIADEDSFMELLLRERRLELAFENERWFDLVRTERLTSGLSKFDADYNVDYEPTTVIKNNVKPYMKFFPIPNTQIQLAAPGVLTQNNGY